MGFEEFDTHSLAITVFTEIHPFNVNKAQRRFQRLLGINPLKISNKVFNN